MADEGKSGSGLKIARLEKGKKDRTARHADVMNGIIDRLNALLSMTVSPQGSGKFVYSDSNVVLQVEATGTGCGDEEPPTTGTFVCGSVDGVKQWIATEECECGVDGGSA